MRTRPTEKCMIGGYEVSTTRLAPTTCLRLAPKLIKILTPALPLVVRSRALDMDADKIGEAINALTATLDDAMIDMLCRELLADTTIIMPNEHGVLTVVELTSPQMVDIAFGGIDDGLSLLVQTLLFVGKVNFKRSFFDAAAAMGLKKIAPVTATTAPE